MPGTNGDYRVGHQNKNTLFGMSSRVVKDFSEKKKAFYLIAFSTTVNDPTEKDWEHSLDYAKELIAKYHKTLPDILTLEKARDKTGVTGQYTTYYAKLGKIILGKMSISRTALLDMPQMKFLYQYKVSTRQWKTASGISNYHKRYNRSGKALTMREYSRMRSKEQRKYNNKKTL